jgi:hypothetical protein
MKSYRPWSPTQAFLLTPSPMEWLPEGHLAYFVLEVAQALDLSEIDGAIQEKDGRGERPYPPAMMVALLVYGYSVGVFSSRRGRGTGLIGGGSGRGRRPAGSPGGCPAAGSRPGASTNSPAHPHSGYEKRAAGDPEDRPPRFGLSSGRSPADANDPEIVREEIDEGKSREEVGGADPGEAARGGPGGGARPAGTGGALDAGADPPGGAGRADGRVPEPVRDRGAHRGRSDEGRATRWKGLLQSVRDVLIAATEDQLAGLREIAAATR